MHVELTEEQEMIRAMAREFADKEVRPIAAEIDRDARFPRETVRRMGALGLLGMTIPPAYGGSGADAVSYVVAMEEIAKACASHAVILSVNNSLYCEPVYKYGSEEQRQRLLVPFVTGEKIGCFALTEPQAGSDATNQTTLAVRAAVAYELAVAYARERRSFGVPIGQHQMVQWMLADMATAIDAARLLTLRAAALKDAKKPFGTAAAMAKLFASETAMKATTDAI